MVSGIFAARDFDNDDGCTDDDYDTVARECAEKCYSNGNFKLESITFMR